MIGSVQVGVRTARWAIMSLALLACTGAQAAPAVGCPGHPDALGTFRTVVVDPREHPRIGTMQYPETLPLEDHEVVLTFDDGPLPRNSNRILEILAAQCVKATFFTIGRQAQASPEGVRKLIEAGHSVGTHTQDHPLSMNRMPIEQARQEIDDGIASTVAALGDPALLSPFFRIPGLLRAEAVEDYLGSLGIQTWSADFLADDRRHVSSSRVYELAIKRLEDKGKGILLLHDIQARTVAALPRILHELKVRGYRVVHVVPATPERPATPTEPQQWQLHPPSETVAISHWPKIPNFVFADSEMLSAPLLADLDGPGGPSPASPEALDRARPHAHGIPLPRQAPWPLQTVLPVETVENTLPVPAESVFRIPERSYAALLASSPASRRAEQAARGEPSPTKLTSIEDEQPRRSVRGKSRHGRAQRTRLAHHAERGSRHAAHSRRGTLKRLVQVKKRSV